MADRPAIAVFDLDVTLTRYDTYLPFLHGYARRHPARWPAIAALPLRLLAPWRWGDRDWVKNSFLRAFLGGESRAGLEAWSEIFADKLYRKAMRPPGLTRLREHQDRGDRVILASASFELYVSRIADRLGIDEVIASRVAWDESDRLVGMHGRNCRGREKLSRVQALLGMENGAGVTAYSDSSADLPLLRWAEKGIAVCPSRRLTHQVGGLGLEVLRW